MTEIVNPLPIPKRKRFVPPDKSPFFPFAVSSSSASASSSATSIVWSHFTGFLIGKWVVVFHRGDAECLSRANFGKGALSKFGLNFEMRDWKPVQAQDADEFTYATSADDDDEEEEDIDGLDDEQWQNPPESRPPLLYRREPKDMKFHLSERRYDKHRRWRSEIEERRVEDNNAKVLKKDDDEDGGEEPEAKKALLHDDPKHKGDDDEGDDIGTVPFLKLAAEKVVYDDDDFLIYQDTDLESEDEEMPPRGAGGGGGGGGSGDDPPKNKRVLFSRREDPLALKECLLLTHEEAFFLSYGLGCLTVMSEARNLTGSSTASSSTENFLSTTPLALVPLWRTFRSFDPRFASKYVAYHFYRSRGWIPRCGLKFGIDFLLYVAGPQAYHATFSVVVDELGPNLKPISSSRDLTSSCASVALSRVTEQVNKELLFCFVVRPKVSNFESRLTSPDCVREFKVKEVLKKRWITDTERDQTKRLLLSLD